LNRIWCNGNAVALREKHRDTHGNHPRRLQQDNEAKTMSGHGNVTREQTGECNETDKPSHNSNPSLKRSKPEKGN